jgi:hypothetical protein
MGINPNTRLGQPRKTPIGIFCGILYVQYDGIFEGTTSTGAFRVPYRIAAPNDPSLGNGTVIVELSHFNVALGARQRYLGEDFLFSRGFSHAGIGWSTTSFDGADRRILDPTVPGVFINGGFIEGNGVVDDEIISEFALALKRDPIALKILGEIDRRYLTGFSDSSNPVLRLLTSGRADGIFNFALPFTAFGQDPQAALTSGLFDGKIIVVNSEFEEASTSFVDFGSSPDQYRFYAVAGSPHIPDHLVIPSSTSRTTPASFSPELRTHFLQGHEWVLFGTQPPLSNHLKTAADGTTLERDVNGNAITVNALEQPVPRLPFVELGEAHYIGDFIGSYENVRTIQELGFASHADYVQAFNARLLDYLNAGYITKEEAIKMFRRSTLCPPRTFTETYRDHYENFVALFPCSI